MNTSLNNTADTGQAPLDEYVVSSIRKSVTQNSAVGQC